MLSYLSLKTAGYLNKEALSLLKKNEKFSANERIEYNLAKYREVKKYFSNLLESVDYGEGLTKSELLKMNPEIENFVRKKKNKLFIGNTSGSTGVPFRFYKTKFSHSIPWWITILRYQSFGIKLSSKQARFYGLPSSLRARMVQRMKDKLLNRIRFDTKVLSDTDLDSYIETFRKTKFEYIFGYGNAVLLFLNYLRDKNVDIKSVCPTLKLVVLTGEYTSPDERALIEKRINIPIISEYGSSEFGYIGIEEQRGVWKVNPIHLHVRTNSKGELLITDLTNTAFPFVDYKLGDIGEIGYDENGYQIIKNLQGRINDILVLKSGKRIHAMSFYYVMKKSKYFSDVREFLIIYHNDSIKFVLVPFKKDFGLNENELAKFVRAYLGLNDTNLGVSVEIVPIIRKEESGKHKFFINLSN